jgi:hypothetical protein
MGAKANEKKAARRLLARQNSVASAASPGGEASEDDPMTAGAPPAEEVRSNPNSDSERQAKKSKPDDTRPPVDAAGASSSASPAAAPMDNADVAQMFQQMMASFAALRTDVNASAAAVGALDVKFDTKIASMDVKIAAMDARISAFGAAPAASPAPAGKAAHWDWDGPSRWNRPAAGSTTATPAASTTPSKEKSTGPRPATSTPAEFGRKVIAVGFPRLLPRPALVAWWEEARKAVPALVGDKGTFQGGMGKSFMVVFPTRDDARAFTSAISTSKAEFVWRPVRAAGEPSPINFKTERTIEERQRGQALSNAWKILSPLVKESSVFNGHMKFITDSRRGCIAVSTGGGTDMWVLVNLVATNGLFSITTEDESFKYFGIPDTVAEAVRTSIAAAPASL